MNARSQTTWLVRALQGIQEGGDVQWDFGSFVYINWGSRANEFWRWRGGRRMNQWDWYCGNISLIASIFFLSWLEPCSIKNSNSNSAKNLGFGKDAVHWGHSCIGNSGAVLRRSFTAAIPAVIMPTQHPLKLSTRIAFVLYYFPSDAHLFLLVYLSFNFQNCCTKEDNGDDGS